MIGKLYAVQEEKQSSNGEIERLLEKFEDVFKEPTTLPPNRNIKHQINLTPGAVPKKQALYRYPHVKK